MIRKTLVRFFCLLLLAVLLIVPLCVRADAPDLVSAVQSAALETPGIITMRQADSSPETGDLICIVVAVMALSGAGILETIRRKEADCDTE